jgi:hypothetical protein
MPPMNPQPKSSKLVTTAGAYLPEASRQLVKVTQNRLGAQMNNKKPHVTVERTTTQRPTVELRPAETAPEAVERTIADHCEHVLEPWQFADVSYSHGETTDERVEPVANKSSYLGLPGQGAFTTGPTRQAYSEGYVASVKGFATLRTADDTPRNDAFSAGYQAGIRHAYGLPHIAR